jgi:hypothetical protein
MASHLLRDLQLTAIAKVLGDTRRTKECLPKENDCQFWSQFQRSQHASGSYDRHRLESLAVFGLPDMGGEELDKPLGLKRSNK